MRILPAALTAILGWGLALPLAAAPEREPAPLLTLEEAIARALAQSPGLNAADAGVDAAAAGIAQARARPNPELGFEAENILGTGGFAGFEGGEYTLSLGQRIELGGKRGARVALAASEREAASRSHETARLDVIHGVHQAYIEAQAAEAALRNAEKQAALRREIEATVRRRAASGRDPEATLRRAVVQAGEAQMDLDQARRAAATAKARLAALWNGMDTDFAVDMARFAALAGGASPEPTETAPDLAVLKAQAARAAAELRLEQARAAQDPTLRLGARHVPETEDFGVVAEFSVPLALFDTNRGNIARAKARAAQAEWTAAEALRRYERERMTLEARLDAARSEALTIRDRLIPGAEEALRLARAGYERGAFSYLDILESGRMLQGLKEREVRVLREWHLARAALDRLTGRDASAPPAEE